MSKSKHEKLVGRGSVGKTAVVAGKSDQEAGCQGHTRYLGFEVGAFRDQQRALGTKTTTKKHRHVLHYRIENLSHTVTWSTSKAKLTSTMWRPSCL